MHECVHWVAVLVVGSTSHCVLLKALNHIARIDFWEELKCALFMLPQALQVSAACGILKLVTWETYVERES